MSEIIKEIKDVSFKRDGKHFEDMDGFEVVTSEQVIRLGINCHGDCCSSQGYFMSNDDLNDFIGAELLGVEITDEALNKKKLHEHFSNEDGGIMFVDLKTNKGVLQFVAYNSHNGYYGTTASIESKQLTDDRSL